MSGETDLFHSAKTAVLPKQPLAAIEYREWLVTGISIPPVFCWTDDWVRPMTFPTVHSISRTGDPYFGHDVRRESRCRT